MSEEVRITKFAVIRRQLDAAIDMFFKNVDDIAIYTVLGGAIRSITDIENKRGLKNIPDTAWFGGLLALHDLLNGNPLEESTKNQFELLAAEMPPDFLDIVRRTPMHQMSAEDILEQFPMPREISTIVWQSWFQPFNFLKHADRDQDGSISADIFVTERLLPIVINQYLALGLEPSNAMSVFMWYEGTRNGKKPEVKDDVIDKVVEVLRNLENEEAKQACLGLIENMSSASN